MAENDKPFECHITGCSQRFSNHDHLTTHQQKHDLSLRFRQGESSLIVDQTPTPTRFLRIGEKIGLFQELEEATSNPFDHDFKSATSEFKSASPDDDDDSASPKSSDDSRGGLTTIPVAPPANLVNPDKPVPMATVPAHINTASALTKQKLLQTIQLKEQQKLLEQTIARQLGGQPELLAQALKNMIPTSVDNSSSSSMMEQHTFMEPTELPRRRRGRKPDDEDPEIKRQRFLERNRAAASRCRAKKKVWVDGLENRCKDMESAKQNLAQEVEMLRSEVKQLKSILIAHKDCPLIVHQRAPPSSGVATSNADVRATSMMGEVPVSSGGMTLLAQLSTMPSMSAFIDSPVPSVGSVVPNMHQHHPLNPSLLMANGLTQQATPEVAKDVEISDDGEEP